MNQVSLQRLDELFYVSPGGHLIRKCNIGSRKKGQVAGCLNADGYIVVRVDSVLFLAHRIVYAMTHGEWPVQVDHINCIKSDNSPANLRAATNGQNKHNCGLNSKNTSGVKGVYWHKINRNWHAQIWKDGKAINLGSHDDLELAELVVSEARRKYHGEFARVV
jgi:hypothetical protein